MEWLSSNGAIKKLRGLFSASREPADVMRPMAVVALAPNKPSSQENVQAAPSKYYRLGWELAGATRAQKPDAGMLKTLDEHASADALAEIESDFDQAQMLDRRTLTRLEALDIELEQRRDELEIAAAEDRRRKDEVAKHPDIGPCPQAAPLFRWVATVAITISVAPTLLSFFVGVFTLLKWLLAIGFGGAIALLIVTAILPDEPTEKKETSK